MTRQSVQQPCRDRFTSGAGILRGWPILGLARFGDQFQVPKALPNRDLELMRIDNASKYLPALLTFCSSTEQVCVLGEEDAPHRCGTIQ